MNYKCFKVDIFSNGIPVLGGALDRECHLKTDFAGNQKQRTMVSCFNVKELNRRILSLLSRGKNELKLLRFIY